MNPVDMDNYKLFSQTDMLQKQDAFLVVNRQVIPLVKKVTTLGRHLSNDVVFQEQFLSRFHAEIILEERRYVLYDKNSTSGTYINGKKISRCILNSGDLISLVNIQFMFVDNNSTLMGKSKGMTQLLRELP